MILFDNWTVRQMMIYQYFLNQCKNFYQFFDKTAYISEIMQTNIFLRLVKNVHAFGLTPKRMRIL